MLLVALGQGFSTNMKIQDLVLYLTMWSCAVICTAGGFYFLVDEFQEGAEQFTWRDSLEENSSSAPTRVVFLCRIALCAPSDRLMPTGTKFYIRRIYAHGRISVYPSIHTDHIHEIQIKSHALSTLIDALLIFDI